MFKLGIVRIVVAIAIFLFALYILGGKIFAGVCLLWWSMELFNDKNITKSKEDNNNE